MGAGMPLDEWYSLTSNAQHVSDYPGHSLAHMLELTPEQLAAAWERLVVSSPTGRSPSVRVTNLLGGHAVGGFSVWEGKISGMSKHTLAAARRMKWVKRSSQELPPRESEATVLEGSIWHQLEHGGPRNSTSPWLRLRGATRASYEAWCKEFQAGASASEEAGDASMGEVGFTHLKHVLESERRPASCSSDYPSPIIKPSRGGYVSPLSAAGVNAAFHDGCIGCELPLDVRKLQHGGVQVISYEA